MRVCIGGTFNILHKGHKLLIDKAFEVAGLKGYVFIGITTGDILTGKKDVKSTIERRKSIEKYLAKKGFINRAVIEPIEDKYGPSVKKEFDAIIVSPETKNTAEDINKKRKELKKKPLKIIQIPFVLSENGLPISSSRIKKKEIDEYGNILKRD
jgi:pantetheine-phosphate adenylyltransferase